MKINDYYQILGLSQTDTIDIVDKRYEKLSIEYYSNPQEFDEERYNKITEAYYIIKSYTSNKNKIYSTPKFSLKRIPMIGKLQSIIKLYGLKLLAVSSASLLVFISAKTIKNVIISDSEDLDLSNSKIAMEIEDKSKKNRVIESIDEDLSYETIIDATSNGNIIKIIEGVTYIDGCIVVNKTYSLPNTYTPENTQEPATKDNGIENLTVETLDAFKELNKDAKRFGLKLWIASGFRSYEYQDKLYNKYASEDGVESADTYSARAGHSEHQTGLAFDLNTVTIDFADTKEGKWINENCYKYGFIIRYPKDKYEETGYVYEPWHLRYVGVELATELYNNGDWITLENHFGITSKYDYDLMTSIKK